MLWVWIALALVAGLAGGFLAGARFIMKTAIEEADRNKASDHDLLMRAYRRELANWLFKNDPDRYRALYERAQATQAEILAADAATRNALMKRIATDMPFIRDFDLGSREYITYGDALRMYSVEDIEEKYLDIVRWQSLQIAGDPAWRYVQKPTCDDDLAYLTEYTARLKDTRFKRRVEEAMRFYWFSQRGDGPITLDTPTLAVSPIYHLVENRYGIHFKDTGEYAIYSSFYDDERDRTYETYRRSSADFSEEKYIDASVEE